MTSHRYTATKRFLAPQHSPRLLSQDLTGISDIFDTADEVLFRKIPHYPNHLLAPLLPNEAHTPYHLRPRRHIRQLIPKNQQTIWEQLHSAHVVQGLVLIDNSAKSVCCTVLRIVSLLLSCVLSIHNKRILYCTSVTHACSAWWDTLSFGVV